MPPTLAPVPDPTQQPKPAAEMAREGEEEGDVLVERDHSQGAPTTTLPPSHPNRQ